MSAQPSDEAARCAAFIEENERQAHANDDCLAAAEAGYAAIQYSVGIGYGFAGDGARELWWYMRAASGGFVEAYLAIGHVVRVEPIADAELAAWWYQRYWRADGQAKGYAAILLYGIEKEVGNTEQAEQWLQRCQETSYEGCSRER